MKSLLRIMQISFTYIGTVVGAGFATGQEIVQFFTSYGRLAMITILIASILFVWLGTKLMLIANRLQAQSYEDVNIALFGERTGKHISMFTLIVLISVNGVMLAGAGSIFVEHLNMHYQTGLLLTMIAAYFVLNRGMNAILHLNSIVVPTMLIFTAFILWDTIEMPSTSNAFMLISDKPLYAAWSAPILYSAFNLAMAQAVLVPLGASMRDEKVIRWGGWIGGIMIGGMLFAGHFALSAHMPGITQYDIPMGHIADGLSMFIQIVYIVLIFSEIFTTFLADVYGVSLQIRQRFKLPPKLVIAGLMLFCFIMSQFGFKPLVAFLYPLFGTFSILWMYLLIRIKPETIPQAPPADLMRGSSTFTLLHRSKFNPFKRH
ncbi:hypothetical protein [Paenibacillus arenosi]|uniref:YkvI family membrane protein n=1 Tax=Paenibacillus arenosi TaxID=2774142 RepID=UPI001CDB7444|nr:hypothetical protein [Paenibacillus arenosi]